MKQLSTQHAFVCAMPLSLSIPSKPTTTYRHCASPYCRFQCTRNAGRCLKTFSRTVPQFSSLVHLLLGPPQDDVVRRKELVIRLRLLPASRAGWRIPARRHWRLSLSRSFRQRLVDLSLSWFCFHARKDAKKRNKTLGKTLLTQKCPAVALKKSQKPFNPKI